MIIIHYEKYCFSFRYYIRKSYGSKKWIVFLEGMYPHYKKQLGCNFTQMWTTAVPKKQVYETFLSVE